LAQATEDGVLQHLADDHELAALADDLLGRLDGEVHALLMDKPGDDGEERSFRERQPEVAANLLGLLLLPLRGGCGLRAGFDPMPGRSRSLNSAADSTACCAAGRRKPG
jgi:hypothetical protein